MEIIAGYEMTSGKELCIGTWDTIQDCARDLGISPDAVVHRLMWAQTHIPFTRGKGGVAPRFYLMRVEIDDEE